MTDLQKVCSVCLSLCFAVVLACLPGPFFLGENIYGKLPLCHFLEKEACSQVVEADEDTLDKIIENNTKYLSEKIREENRTTSSQLEPSAALTREVSAAPHPVIDLSPEALADPAYFRNQFFIQDEKVSLREGLLDAKGFLERDLRVDLSVQGPQIVIYHSHSQEAFADSRPGNLEDTVVGVGNYLTQLLQNRYGYQVMHVTEAFDLAGGQEDRSRAYDYARAYLEPFLADHPSVQVLIDLHRDGVSEDRHLVKRINGKQTAQIMFFNGVSRTVEQGEIPWLPNPYIEDNLAFSFQMEYQAALYYPEFYRGIYLAGLRYNLHLLPRSVLLEAGAQTNTVEEVKNAMEPFAFILDRVLKRK